MGVLGLYSYFESRSLGHRKFWTSSNIPVSLTKDGCQPDPTRHHARVSKRRYFILDGNAYIHHLYCTGPFEWIWGGQYSAFANLLTAQVQALEDAGFGLIVLFDGALPLQKLQTRLARDTEKIRKMSRVMGDFEHYYHGYSGMPGPSHSLHDPPQQPRQSTMASASINYSGGYRSNSQFLIPPLVMEVTLQTLRSLGVQVTVCDGEADGLVAQLAKEMSLDPSIDEAYAVSKDSGKFASSGEFICIAEIISRVPFLTQAFLDYFIYDTGSSVKGGYIPLDNLFVQVDPITNQTTISATVYSQSTISVHLGIRVEFLRLFASLTGNDYLRPEVFEDQIAKALATTTGRQVSKASNTNYARIRATATFLREHGAGPATGSNTPRTVDDVVDRILKDRKTLYPSENEDRRQELRLSLEESMNQYVITLKDFSTQESISPNSPTDSFPSTPCNATRAGSPLPLPTIECNWSTIANWLALSKVKARRQLVLTNTGMDRVKDAFRVGQFSYKLMDVLGNRMFWCTPFLEDIDRESSWLPSRELRRWIYGILFRNILEDEIRMSAPAIAVPPQAIDDGKGEQPESAIRDVVEYVRRGDHLAAEIVVGASDKELEGLLEMTNQLFNERSGATKFHADVSMATAAVGADLTAKTARRVSDMDIDAKEDLGEPVSRVDPGQFSVESKGLENAEKNGDDGTCDTSRISLFLGILGSNTLLVRALPRPFMVLAATLRYLVNALAHSKTRSASASVANFEVIAFVATVLFIREKYSSVDSTKSNQRGSIPQTSFTSTEVASGTTPSTPITNASLTAVFEAPPITKRSLHLSTQYQHVLSSVSLLANALHLEDLMPPLASLFDGLLFQQTLALARGGTSVEQRFRLPESLALYEDILAAVEEGLVDSGEIDVVVLFRSKITHSGRRARALRILGADVEILNPLAGTQLSPPSSLQSSTSSQSSALLATSGAASSSHSLKVLKSGVQKRSLIAKKRSKVSSTSSGNGSSNSGNMFNVLSLGCEFE
ncbi:hypothetical protein BG004_002141 [Podila humilis]|nr:hypothetical protein BG004_002141 [Podila humilis]